MMKPEIQEQFEKLLTEYGNWSFDCGGSGDADYYSYEELAVKAQEAKKAIVEFFKAHANTVQ